jgi:hypothetical protein
MEVSGSGKMRLSPALTSAWRQPVAGFDANRGQAATFSKTARAALLPLKITVSAMNQRSLWTR